MNCSFSLKTSQSKWLCAQANLPHASSATILTWVSLDLICQLYFLSRLMLHFALLSESGMAFYSFKLPAAAVSHDSWGIGLNMQRLWMVLQGSERHGCVLWKSMMQQDSNGNNDDPWIHQYNVPITLLVKALLISESHFSCTTSKGNTCLYVFGIYYEVSWLY